MDTILETNEIVFKEKNENIVANNANTLAARAAAMGWQVKETVVETISVVNTKTGLKVKAGGYFVNKSAELANPKLADIVLSARNAYAKAVAVAEAEAERQSKFNKVIIDKVAELLIANGKDVAETFADIVLHKGEDSAKEATANAAVARVTEKVTHLDEPIKIIVANKKHFAGDFQVDDNFNVLDDVYQQCWTETRIVG